MKATIILIPGFITGLRAFVNSPSQATWNDLALTWTSREARPTFVRSMPIIWCPNFVRSYMVPQACETCQFSNHDRYYCKLRQFTRGAGGRQLSTKLVASMELLASIEMSNGLIDEIPDYTVANGVSLLGYGKLIKATQALDNKFKGIEIGLSEFIDKFGDTRGRPKYYYRFCNSSSICNNACDKCETAVSTSRIRELFAQLPDVNASVEKTRQNILNNIDSRVRLAKEYASKSSICPCTVKATSKAAWKKMWLDAALKLADMRKSIEAA